MGNMGWGETRVRNELTSKILFVIHDRNKFP